MPLVVLPDGRCLSVEMHKIAYKSHDYFAENQLRRVDSDTGEVLFSKSEISLCTTSYIDNLISSAGEEVVKRWIEVTEEANAILGSQGMLTQRFVQHCNDSSEAMGGSGKKNSALIFRELEQYIGDARALFKDVLANSNFSGAEEDNTEVPVEQIGSDSTAEHVPDAPPSAIKPNASGSIKTQDDAVVKVDSALMYLLDHERSNPAIIFLVYARKLIGLNFVEILKFFKGDDEQETSVLSAANELSGGFGQLLLKKIELGKLDDELNNFKAEMDQKYATEPCSESKPSDKIEDQSVGDVTENKSAESENEDEGDTAAQGDTEAQGEARAQDEPQDSSAGDSGASDGSDQSGTDHKEVGKVPVSSETQMPEVENRDHALANLSSAATYFKVREPASPVSDLLTRAVTVADSDFMSALANLTGEADSD
jgi:hypothetical protein